MNKIYADVKDGKNQFYLETAEGRFYLFAQDYRVGVNQFFKEGVSVEKALCNPPYNDNARFRTKTKLLKHIKYVQKEYDILVLKRDIKFANKKVA